MTTSPVRSAARSAIPRRVTRGLGVLALMAALAAASGQNGRPLQNTQPGNGGEREEDRQRVLTLRGPGAQPPPSQESDREPFEFLLSVSAARQVREPRGYDPTDRTDTSGTPVSREVKLIAGWKIGMYRRQGPHAIASHSQWMRRHMKELTRDVNRLVPREFTGPVIIDYEPWWALWRRTMDIDSDEGPDARDDDYRQDWRDYIRAERPQLVRGLSEDQAEEVYEATYEAFMRTYLLSTIYKCKQLRPNAQWGFYNYPQVLIHSDLTPYGVQGYGDLTHEASTLNNRNQWLYDAVDFVAPRIYPARQVLPEWPPEGRQPGQINPSVHEMWLSSMVRESVRLAKGKPVYPLHSAIYFSSFPFRRQSVSQYQHEEVFRICAENGAAGVIVWHSVDAEDELDQWWDIWDNKLKPASVNADHKINGGPEPEPDSASGS